MGAVSAGHGVINIDIKPAKTASAVQSSAAPSYVSPVGARPEPVVQHKTTQEVEQEAAALQVAAEQLRVDAVNVVPG